MRPVSYGMLWRPISPNGASPRSLPDGSIARTSALPSVSEPGMSQPLRILICDDNVDVARTLALWMEIEGHEVRVVHDGPAALAAARELPPDVVLMDLGLGPPIDGVETAQRHAARTRPGGRAARGDHRVRPGEDLSERTRPALTCIWSSRRRWRRCGKCWRGAKRRP